jgi:hypothetical protein
VSYPRRSPRRAQCLPRPEVPRLRWTRFDLSGWTVVTVPDTDAR